MCVVWIASLITFVRNDNYCLNILIFCHYEEQRDEVIHTFRVYRIKVWVMDCRENQRFSRNDNYCLNILIPCHYEE